VNQAQAEAVALLLASCREMLREQARREKILADRAVPSENMARAWLRGFVDRGRAALAAASAAGLIPPPAAE
jgi:hypothetical protein